MLMPMLWNRNNDVFDMDSTMNDMSDLFNSFWGNNLETTHSMRTDVIEGENSYQLKADLPGFNKEDIHIDMKDGILSINASHTENKDEKDKNGKYIRRERSSSSYERSFRIPEELKPEDIGAKYENGVLTVTLPKKEAIPEKKEAARIAVQ